MTWKAAQPLVLGMLGMLGMLDLAACDAQVDPGYAGEPMARLRGMASGFTADELATSAIILWNQNRGVAVPSGPEARQPLHPQFPSGLTIDILAAPADDAFFSVAGEGASIAEGYLHLADPRGAVIGAANDIVLVFVRGAVEESSLSAGYLGGVRTPGYHLLAWRATADLTDAQQYFSDGCVESMVGSGALSRADAETECRQPRRYKLVDSSADLGTTILFYRRLGL